MSYRFEDRKSTWKKEYLRIDWLKGGTRYLIKMHV